ncbi:hypothetical protein [Amycolatopsis sp. cmx-8-4]|uniref:hypothetical protein n=1 Tax=Amycolatopsis sp. cmx-8-4 TaxID=2790947 RepID=UPI00397A2F39
MTAPADVLDHPISPPRFTVWLSDKNHTRCRRHRVTGTAPVLDDCVGWFAGEILGRERTGDHVTHLLRPIKATEADVGAPGTQPGFPAVRDLTPGNEP